MKESQIQTAIETYLRYLENRGKLVYTKNNSGAFTSTYKGKRSFVRFGKAGSPDFVIFYKDGRVLHLEVKNEKGAQNDNQKQYQANVERLGHKYVIVRSLDEVEKVLTANQII